MGRDFPFTCGILDTAVTRVASRPMVGEVAEYNSVYVNTSRRSCDGKSTPRLPEKSGGRFGKKGVYSADTATNHNEPIGYFKW